MSTAHRSRQTDGALKRGRELCEAQYHTARTVRSCPVPPFP